MQTKCSPENVAVDVVTETDVAGLPTVWKRDFNLTNVGLSVGFALFPSVSILLLEDDK